MDAINIRYVVSIVRKDGVRVLFDPQQGRFTFASSARAQRRLDAFANSDDRSLQVLRNTYGPGSVETLAVWAVECWGSGDPKSFYVQGVV